MTTLCDRCADPGRCCRSIRLTRGGEPITFWLASWREDAEKLAGEHDLPFDVERVDEQWLADDGAPYGTLRWSCPHVVDGRCGIYERRPALCRDFVAGAEGEHLCVMMPPTNRDYVPESWQ